MSEVHIGNPKGRIAVWLDEQDAHDMAAHYGYRDAFSSELISAIDKAYPPEEESEWDYAAQYDLYMGGSW